MRSALTTAATVAVLAWSALAEPGIEPATFNETTDPGSSFNFGKAVTTPEIPPKPDVVLLVDVTGSMSPSISDIKTNLNAVIAAVTAAQSAAEFAVVSFGDFADPNAFQVVQDLTANEDALQAAVDSLSTGFGGDEAEDWINALFQIATGAVSFRSGSSRIAVVVSDAPSHEPSGGHTLAETIGVLIGQGVRVIGVNVGNLDGAGQATAVTAATGGGIVSSAADAVTGAIVSGLKNLDVTIVPAVACDAGVTVEFRPPQVTVGSGTTFIFDETVIVSDTAKQNAKLRCAVTFLQNGAPGGDAFVQNVTMEVNQMGCFLCDPRPGKNLCHPTTSCAPTPYGTMCLTRPGFKADGADDDDVKKQWRMTWPAPGHEHRVAVRPGTSSDTLCDRANKGSNVCKEVVLADCKAVLSAGAWLEDATTEQTVLGDWEL